MAAQASKDSEHCPSNYSSDANLGLDSATWGSIPSHRNVAQNPAEPFIQEEGDDECAVSSRSTSMSKEEGHASWRPDSAGVGLGHASWRPDSAGWQKPTPANKRELKADPSAQGPRQRNRRRQSDSALVSKQLATPGSVQHLSPEASALRLNAQDFAGVQRKSGENRPMDFEHQLHDAAQKGEEAGRVNTIEQLQFLLLGQGRASLPQKHYNDEPVAQTPTQDYFMPYPGLAGRSRSVVDDNQQRPVGGGRGGGPGAGPNLRRGSSAVQKEREKDKSIQAAGQSKPSFDGPNRFPGGLELMQDGQPSTTGQNSSLHHQHPEWQQQQEHSALGHSTRAPDANGSACTDSLFASNAANVSMVDKAEAQAVKNSLSRFRFRFKEFFAELIACTLLVLVGGSVDAQVRLSQKLNPEEQAGSYSSQNWAWGLAVMCTIHLAGGISGAHCNPGITVGLALFRGFPWTMVWVYLLAQYLGCFCGAGLAFAIYEPAINLYEGLGVRTIVGNHATGGFFTTVPSATSTPASAFGTELCASAILGAMVLAIGDDSNSPPGDGMSALILGLTVTMIGMSFGWNSGYPINPARDLGPRVLLSFVGYGKEVWTHNNWWWTYGGQAATYLGTLIGCFFYDLFLYHGRDSPLNSVIDWRWQWLRYKTTASAPFTTLFVPGRRVRKSQRESFDPDGATELEDQTNVNERHHSTEASQAKDDIERSWAHAAQKVSAKD